MRCRHIHKAFGQSQPLPVGHAEHSAVEGYRFIDIAHCEADMVNGFQHTGCSRADKTTHHLNAPRAVYHSRLDASIIAAAIYSRQLPTNAESGQLSTFAGDCLQFWKWKAHQ